MGRGGLQVYTLRSRIYNSKIQNENKKYTFLSIQIWCVVEIMQKLWKRMEVKKIAERFIHHIKFDGNAHKFPHLSLPW
jgi:hypothetical protein